MNFHPLVKYHNTTVVAKMDAPDELSGAYEAIIKLAQKHDITSDGTCQFAIIELRLAFFGEPSSEGVKQFKQGLKGLQRSTKQAANGVGFDVTMEASPNIGAHFSMKTFASPEDKLKEETRIKALIRKRLLARRRSRRKLDQQAA